MKLFKKNKKVNNNYIKISVQYDTYYTEIRPGEYITICFDDGRGFPMRYPFDNKMYNEEQAIREASKLWNERGL